MARRTITESLRAGKHHYCARPRVNRATNRAWGQRNRQPTPDAAHEHYKRKSLKPHLVKTFTLSRDRAFVETLCDVVGLYLNPPDKSLLLCVDEKSQIQVLDRTQPGLPMRKGRLGTRTAF